MALLKDAKWHMPGWRIEQKFAPKVLIGNWYEDRKDFDKRRHDHNSTHRIDFRHYPQHQPDTETRRKGAMRSEGQAKEQLLYHHGKRYNDNIYISLYDEKYNRRERTNPLPETRDWDGRKIAWVPEASDHPLEGCPTNWGLLEQKQASWGVDNRDARLPDLNTTYLTSYERPEAGARLTPSDRASCRRHMSTRLHPVNGTLKDLHLRNHHMLKMPEVMDEVTLSSLAKVHC